jgi:hypothetical protein
VREDEAVAQKQERQSLLSLSHLFGSFPFVLLACSCPRGQQGRSFRQSASHLSLFGVLGLSAFPHPVVFLLIRQTVFIVYTPTCKSKNSLNPSSSTTSICVSQILMVTKEIPVHFSLNFAFESGEEGGIRKQEFMAEKGRT